MASDTRVQAVNQLVALQKTPAARTMSQDAELGGCGCCPVRKGQECCCPVCYKQACWAGNAAAGCGLWCVSLVLCIVVMIIDKHWWLWVLSFFLLCPISIIWGVTGCSCLVCCRERNDRVAPAVEMQRYGGQAPAAYDSGPVMAKMAPAGPPLAPQPVVYQPAVQQPLQGAVVTGTVVQASVVGSPEEKEEAW